jgi:flagellar biosynthesis chaperone FliJ
VHRIILLCIAQQVAELQEEQMSKQLQDLVNAGIGLYKAGEENLQGFLKTLQSAFEDLKSKGAQDSSETAAKLRASLEQTIKGVQDVSVKAEGNLKVILDEAKKNYEQVFEQIKAFVGEERIKDLNTRIDELGKLIKERADGISGQPTGAAQAKAPKAPSAGS